MTNIIKSSPILALVAIAFSLLTYNYLSAAWTPPSTPPTANVDAPLNVGTGIQDKAGGLTMGSLGLFSSSPTMLFYDQTAGEMPFWLHNNQNRLYFLADRNRDGSWSGENPWPMFIEAGATSAGDYAYFSNQVRSPNYCDIAGGNCFTPATVAGINTSNFLTTANDTQTKAGNIIANIFDASGQMRADSYCNGTGGNCIAQTDLGSGGMGYYNNAAEVKVSGETSLADTSIWPRGTAYTPAGLASSGGYNGEYRDITFTNVNYKACFITAANQYNRDDETQTGGGGCDIDRINATTGQWKLRAFAAKRSATHCAASCVRW